MNNQLPPLAVTMGEPAGIGGELTLMAWHARDAQSRPFFIIDDPARIATLATRTGIATPIEIIDHPQRTAEIFARALPVLPLTEPVVATNGAPDPSTAGAVQESIRRAVELTCAGHAAAVITNPIQKETMYAAGFTFPGHTEFLASLVAEDVVPVMMLASTALRVVPVTIHVSLRQALDTLATETIISRARITARDLTANFGIARPRLAVAGLNPHAGEGGTMGDEEARVIAPAVVALATDGIDVVGPLSPDTMFTAQARAGYDVAICMYHDQALIPIKTIGFEDAVNVTLGLPFIRTSPDHGTALDIAGTGRADPSSLIASLRMAAEMAEYRRGHADAAS